MKKSISGLMIIVISTLAFCSNAISQIPHSTLKYLFNPYRQVNISPSIQPFVQSKIEKSTYSVEYGRSSSSNHVPLDNALLTVKVYYNGTPKGVVTIAADDQQHFLFANLADKSSVVFELLSIDGQDQPISKCFG